MNTRLGLVWLLAGMMLVAATVAGGQEPRLTSVSGNWEPLVGGWHPIAGSASQITWTETKAGVTADLPSAVLFDFDSAALRPEAKGMLDELARGIKSRAPRLLQIEGHTDAKGSDAYNQNLSERRAQAVLNYLAERGGLDRQLMQAKGFGESRPIAPNAKPDGSDDPEGRQRNRRVEVVLEIDRDKSSPPSGRSH